MMIYTLRVEVIGGPHDFGECVRVIEIPEEMTLLDLHDAIQESVKFDDDHLFQFYAGRGPRNRTIVYGDDESYEAREDDDAELALNKVYPLKRMNLYYRFDFDDEWLFEIKKLPQVKPPHPRANYPRVIEKIGRKPAQYSNYE